MCVCVCLCVYMCVCMCVSPNITMFIDCNFLLQKYHRYKDG